MSLPASLLSRKFPRTLRQCVELGPLFLALPYWPHGMNLWLSKDRRILKNVGISSNWFKVGVGIVPVQTEDF